MEECNMSEIVGSYNLQGARNEQSRYCDSKMYMVPNAAQFDDESQYEELQISTLTVPLVASKKQSPSQQRANQSLDIGQSNRLSSVTNARNNSDKVTKKKKGCVAICMFLTVLAVIALGTVAIGALSFRGNSIALLAIDTLEEETLNYTSYFLDEIQALNVLLVQLHADTQRNISLLLSQLSNQHQEITIVSRSLSTSVSRLSTSATKFSISASQVSASVSHLSTSLSTSVSRLSTSVLALSNSAHSLSASVFSVSRSASQHSYAAVISINQLSTSGHSLSSSVRQLSFSSIYSVSSSVSRLSSLSIYSVSSSVRRLSSSSFSSLSSSVYSLSYSSRYVISPSVSRLSRSVSRLSSSFANQCTRYCYG